MPTGLFFCDTVRVQAITIDENIVFECFGRLWSASLLFLFRDRSPYVSLAEFDLGLARSDLACRTQFEPFRTLRGGWDDQDDQDSNPLGALTGRSTLCPAARGPRKRAKSGTLGQNAPEGSRKRVKFRTLGDVVLGDEGYGISGLTGLPAPDGSKICCRLPPRFYL